MNAAFASKRSATLVPIDASEPAPADLRVIVCVSFNRNASPEEVAALKQTVIACHSVINAVEVTGTFDFLIELTVPDIATFNDRLKAVAACVARLVERYEVNFVSKRFLRSNGGNRSLWIQSGGGLIRVDHSAIDKVTAEGDYMRVHSNGRTWMLHATMRSLLDRLDGDGFIQLHRSTVVRADFIDELTHREGRWVARLRDGTSESVAKSHVAGTLEHLKGH